MKNRRKVAIIAAGICTLASFGFPAYAYASDGEDYITISVDAVDDNADLRYALDSDDESAFSDSNEFTVPAGTSHTIYVKDAAGNITSQKYDPQEVQESSYSSYEYERSEAGEEQQINIDLELGRKKEEEIEYPDAEGNPGTASVTDRTKTDGSVDAEKVFYTFTTKEGEELYLVVDQGRGSDNVYLLDTVSLGDLRVLADGHETTSSTEKDEEDNLLSILAEENGGNEVEEELETPKKNNSSMGNGLLILLLAGIGGGAYYYLKVYRTKKDEVMDAMDAMDMDEFAPEDDEEEEVDFDYDAEEKERFLEELINDEDPEEEDLYEQDPESYVTSHMEDAASEEEESEDDMFDFDGMDDI